MFKEIDSLLRSELTLAEYMKITLTLSANLALMFLSGGAAFLVKAALVLQDAFDLIDAIEAALKASKD